MKEKYQELKELFDIMPKADLHAHFWASLPLDFVDSIINFSERGSFLPERYENLEEFVKKYDEFYYGSSLAHLENQEKGAYLICMEAARHNVKCMELKSAIILNPFGDLDTWFSISRGIEKARVELEKKGFMQEVGIQVTLIKVNFEYDDFTFDEALKDFLKISKDQKYKIVGVDIAGLEHIRNFKDKYYKEFLSLAKKNNINITVHAGEERHNVVDDYNPVQEVYDAIAFGAKRIGHAVHLLEDDNLVQKIKDCNICIEKCPSSNIRINHIDNWSDLGIKELLDRDVKVCICTDDQSMLDTNCSKEFFKLYENNIITKWDDIKKLLMNSIEYSFINNAKKKVLINIFKEEINNLENNSKYSAVIKKYLL